MLTTYRDGIGVERCATCLYTVPCTCPPTPKGSEPMAKRKPGRKKWSAERKNDAETHRVNTINSNGDLPESQEVAPEKVTVGEAMRRAVESLGEVVIDETMAPAHLREISEAYEQVVREQAAYDAKAEEAKTAKKSLESATNLLLEKVRAATHPQPLPLFDQKQAEQDLENMVGAANDDDAEGEELRPGIHAEH